MSRIGKQTIQIPTGVQVTFQSGILTVKGPKGTLTKAVHPLVTVNITGETMNVDVKNKEEKQERSLWGTYSSHVQNMIQGVTDGYKKSLEINGVGYRVAMQGKDLKFDVGFSHPVIFAIPEGIVASVEKNVINLVGFDKELIGQIAANVRAIKKPEPYKGKGIKYTDEIIRRKAGKTAKA